MRPSVLCEVKKIVDRVSEILFAAEIVFRRLHGRMPQQELNLFQFATAREATAISSNSAVSGAVSPRSDPYSSAGGS
jgi:hypothetical protein